MKTKSNPFLRHSLALAASSAFLSMGAAQATDFTWDGIGNWTDTTWTPGPITGPTASTDTATINTGTVTITSLTIDSAIQIDSGATLEAYAVQDVGNVSLNGNLTGSGILNKTGGWSLFLAGNNSGFSGTVNANNSNIFLSADSATSAAADWVITNGAKVVNIQSGTGHLFKLGSLAGDSGYVGSNSSGSEVTFEIGGNGDSTTFGGQIVNTPPGYGGGTTSITKVGGGTLTLSGANDYSGITTVTAGTLILDASPVNGTYNGGEILINGASTLRVQGLRHDFGGKTITFDSVGGGTIDAVATGQGGLVFTGGNTFATSRGAQNIISGTRIENQGFNLNNETATFNVTTGTDATSDLKVIGTIWNGGSVIKNGAGRLEISAPQQYSGTTTINDGTLILGDGTNNVGLSDTHDVTIASGATLRLNYLVGNPDSIDELWLGGVQQNIGTYGAGTYSGVTITGTGLLNVLTGPPIADPFLAWIDSFFPGETDPLIIGATADPDNDGIENLVEYVLKNGDPDASSTGILPTLNATGADFVFTYLRRTAATGTTQTFQYGSNLIGWTNVLVTNGGIVSITSPEAGIEQVVITVPKVANTKLFGRLQVVK